MIRVRSFWRPKNMSSSRTGAPAMYGLKRLRTARRRRSRCPAYPRPSSPVAVPIAAGQKAGV